MPEAPFSLATDARARIVGIGVEFLQFTWKEAQACLFAGLFFVAVFCVPRTGVLGLPRYDMLLLIALVIQGGMLWSGRETLD